MFAHMLHKPFLKQLKGGKGKRVIWELLCPISLQNWAAGRETIGEKKTLNIYIIVNSVMVLL